MAANKTKAVYLDHSVVNQFAHPSDGSFTRTKLADAIQDASDAGSVEIWASPASVAEILLCTRGDNALAKRQRMADCLLHLIEARRMFPASTFRLAREFLQFLDSHATGAAHFAYLDSNDYAARQCWLGVLGLLAAYRDLNLTPEAREELLRAKFETKLRFHRILRNPQLLVNEASSVAHHSVEDIRLEFANMSIEDLEREVERAKSEDVKRIDKETKKRLRKRKDGAISRYGVDECLAALVDALKNDLELFASFNVKALGASKHSILKRTSSDEKRVELKAHLDHVGKKVIVSTQTIVLLVRGLVGEKMLNVRLVTEYLLEELSESWDAGKGATPGVTYDADHVLSLRDVDVFATTDGRMAKIAKKLARAIERETGRRPTIVQDAREFRKALI